MYPWRRRQLPQRKLTLFPERRIALPPTTRTRIPLLSGSLQKFPLLRTRDPKVPTPHWQAARLGGDTSVAECCWNTTYWARAPTERLPPSDLSTRLRRDVA
eukprot:1905852-Amphidinium_carterae.1